MSINKKSTHSIVADVGGTNCRFALCDNSTSDPIEALSDISVYKTEDYPGFIEALAHYLSKHFDGAGKPLSACFAFACPVGDCTVCMTNNKWTFLKEDLTKRVGIDNVTYINDFQANAFSILSIKSENLKPIGNPKESKKYDSSSYLVSGPGTGLGVSTLVYRGGSYTSVPTEGGHSSFAPRDDLQIEILKYLQSRFVDMHVSNERILSGPGIANLYDALCRVKNVKAVYQNQIEIVKAAHRGKDKVARETMALFFRILAEVMSNYTITTGSVNGVYLTSDVINKNLDLFDEKSFRQYFNKRGRYTEYMAEIPIYLIQQKWLGLIGAASVVTRDDIVV